jgi:hypothetical protein
MMETIGKKGQEKKLNFSEFDLYRVEVDVIKFGGVVLISADVNFGDEPLIKIDNSNLSPNDVQVVISSDLRYAYRAGSVDNIVKIQAQIRSYDFTVGDININGNEARESISCEDPDIASTKIHVFTKFNETDLDYPRLVMNALIINNPTTTFQCLQDGKMYSDILIRRNIITNIREMPGAIMTKINN